MTSEPVTVCPGCGARLPSTGAPPPDPRLNASAECRELMNQLSYFTLAKADLSFLHQHLVDVYGAQHVSPDARSTIGPAFALAGLYLAVERGFSGGQVQKLHMRMARSSKQWPPFAPPTDAGPVTAADVVTAEPGPALDAALMDWCVSVWRAWSKDHERVRQMVDRFL